MSDRVGLSYETWPKADRAMWDGLVSSTTLFENADALNNLSQVTLRELRAAYGYYLGYLTAEGIDIFAEPLSRRITTERLRGWVLENQHRLATSSQSVYTARLFTVLRSGFPGADLKCLEIAGRNLSRRAKREHSHAVAEPLPDVTDVVRLGQDLISEAEGIGPCSCVLAAESWRDGLLILFLAHHPIRARNLAELTWGRTLLKGSSGYRVAIPGKQTKTGKPIDYHVDPEVSLLLERYIEEIMPLFPTPMRHTDRLWRTRRGTVLAAKGLGRRVGDVTEAALGIRVTPHDFRKIAANTLVLTEGANSGDASALLGHADPKVTRRHYITAGSLEISRRYGKLVTDLMQKRGDRPSKREATS